MKSTLPFGYWLKRLGFDLLKGAAAALAGIIGLVIGGMAATLVGLPAATVPAYLDVNRVLLLMFLSGIPVAILLGECFRGLYPRYWARVFFIFMCNYILYYLLNLLDGLLFSPLPNMTTAFFSDVFPALFTALVTAALWRPATGAPARQSTPLLAGGRGVLAGRMAGRFALAWLVFPPIYYLIGLVVGQFTRSYYEDPSHSLGLVLPPLNAIMLMQVARGGLFLLAVLPVIFAWRGSRKGLWLWTGSLIFLQIAANVLFQAYWLPAAVRIPHALELLVDSFLQAGLYVLLLAPVRMVTARKAAGGLMSHASQP